MEFKTTKFKKNLCFFYSIANKLLSSQSISIDFFIMKIFVRMLLAFILMPMTMSASSLKNDNGVGNAVKLGTDTVLVGINVVTDIDGFDVAGYLDQIEVRCYTLPIFSHTNEDVKSTVFQSAPTGDGPGDIKMYFGFVPVERKEEVATISLFKDGDWIGGTQVVLQQGVRSGVIISINGEDKILRIEYKPQQNPPIRMEDWFACNEIGWEVLTMYPPLAIVKELYEGPWKNLRDYEANELWPMYEKKTFKGNFVSGSMIEWLRNNVKSRFATNYVLPCVENAKKNAGVDIAEPPMEAYSFLDSINYSPDVFLKTTMQLPIMPLLSGILAYAGGGLESIGERKVRDWEDYAYKKLRPAIRERHPLLMDLLAGASYVNQIESGKPLSAKQIENINNGFSDDIGKIVIAVNNRCIERGMN